MKTKNEDKWEKEISKIVKYLRGWDPEDDPRGNLIDIADRLEKICQDRKV